MAIDPPLESEEKPTKTIPERRAQNGLPTHSSQDEAAMKHTLSILSGAIVKARKTTNIFYRRSLRTCYYQRQRLWPLRNRKHLSRDPRAPRITFDHRIVVVAA